MSENITENIKENISDYILENILGKIKRLPRQTEESLNDALGLIVQLEESADIVAWCRWARKIARALRTEEAYEIVRKTYFLAGRHNFDDFMIAMEWNREPKARFWLPRRKVLEGKHHIATQIQEFMDDPDALFLGFSMPPGCGKTTLIKFLLAYIIGKDPKSANMYISYSDGMTKMMLDSAHSVATVSGTAIKFNNRTAIELNFAPFVQFLLSEKDKQFAIRACKKEDPGAVPFSKPAEAQKASIKISVAAVMDRIRKTANWALEESWNIPGVYFAKENALVYDMSLAYKPAPARGGWDAKRRKEEEAAKQETEE